jgi:formylglycine-generating enzyme required for sulfatase activity
MMRTEVTNAQYRQCVEAGACSRPQTTTYYNDPARANHPVVHVKRWQAQQYATWVGGSLPTRNQWQWSCFSSQIRNYPWGNQAPTSDLANYNNNVGSTKPVGSYPSGDSAFGVHDMAGNVFEWLNDGAFVIVGGAFDTAGLNVPKLKCENSEYYGDYHYQGLGFRVVAP